MKFGVVTFPGSNCDQDMMYILRDVMKQEVVHLWHKDSDLQGADMVVLPGGFSFGDYLRSGAISRFSPIMTEVISHANKGGYVLGICNGFQILTEAGLLDGALLHNNNQKFICKNVHLKAISSSAAISAGLNRNEAFKIPIAHGEGRYHASSEVIESLEQNDQVLFKYCNEKGEISGESNPNGSIHNIAGISNKEKNVFGMMPHPERASDDVLSNSEGRNFFESILKHS
ncbi:MAG: phosphoribosylformylglycinamidine synthase subunit PurQ [Crocinitomicaceae bacterium]|nr:phosphoribosylformylglycinamidine synthase subunit PurQ [Crocinitomicaceae bacterium]